MSTAKRGNVLLTVLAAAGAFGFHAGRAEAQWGMGFGGGMYGFGGFSNVPQPVTFLNSVALSQMNHVRGPRGTNPYAGNPNSYFNHVRDNGFVDQYSPYRREPSYSQSPSPAQARRMTPTAMTVAHSKPVVPLASFYNAQNQLVWPGDAPTTDSLKEKRTIVDQASLAVLDEAKKNGVASVAAVTEARQKLLDYGRPALHYVRSHETARLADTFHVFLLELYDSLAQAATPSGTATAGTPAS
jgi:hypothetical protein